MWRHLGRLNCVCRRSRVRNYHRSPLHRSVRCANSAIPSSAASPLQSKNNKAVNTTLLFLSYEYSTTPSGAPYRASGGRNRRVRAADGAMEGGASVFRRMLLKQTPVCCNSFQFADNACVLEITIRHPDFNNTEILLRRNSYPIYMRNHI
jgi:hypothetical protein